MKKELKISNLTLIEECRKGDKEALNLFYLRFAPRMLSVIHRYIRDPEDAEDILHDGFIIGLTRLDSLRDADKVEVWLATIMKNLSLRFLMEQDMHRILHDIPEVEDSPDLEQLLDLNTLESLIAKLPPGYQRVFRLALLENKSHKEIGALLGIAPNSSSSQLFHAKLMIRKLIKDHKLHTGLMTLLLALVPIGIHIRNLHSSHLIRRQAISVVKKYDESKIPSLDSVTAPATEPVIKANALSFVKENKMNPREEEIEYENFTDNLQSPTDTNKLQPERITERVEYHYAEVTGNDISGNHHLTRTRSSGWALNIGADPGLLSFNSRSSGDNDYYGYPGGDFGNTEPPEIDDQTDKMSKLPQKSGRFNDYSNVVHSDFLPISVALTISKKINGTFSIETGLRYTYLHSQFETTSSLADCHWHYMGIPLKVNVMAHSSHRFKLYVGGGGSIDIPLYSGSEVSSYAAVPDLETGRFSSPTVWSLSGNIGVSIKLSEKIDIFFEPTLQYHFQQDYTVPNTWTDNKWSLSIPLGLRLNM